MGIDAESILALVVDAMLGGEGDGLDGGEEGHWREIAGTASVWVKGGERAAGRERGDGGWVGECV